MSRTPSPRLIYRPIGAAALTATVLVLSLVPNHTRAAPSEFELRAAMITPAEFGANFGAWDRHEAFPHPKFPAVPGDMTHFRTAHDRTTRNPTVIELLSIMLIDATNEPAATAALMEFAESRVAVRGFAAVAATPAPGQTFVASPRSRRTAQPPPPIADSSSRFTMEGPGTTADVIIWRYRDVMAVVISEKITDPTNGDVASALGYAQLQQNKLISVLPLGAAQQPAVQPTPAAPPPSITAAIATVTPAQPLVLQPRVVGSFGTVLADAQGFTLYTFDGDRPGESVCADGCAAVWPPLLVEQGGAIRHDGVAGVVSVIRRADGSWQVALNDRPLYRYTGDHQPGDASGHGLGGVWRVAVVSPL